MRALVLACLVACSGPGPYICATSSDCGDGFCEADGLCSVADVACPSGRRYGDLAGALAGTCVGGDLPSEERALCGATAARPDGTGTCAAEVCAADPTCCEISWDRQCARTAEAICELACEEIVAAGGFQFAAAFPLSSPGEPLFSTGHSGFLFQPAWGDIDGDGNPDLAIARDGDTDLDIPGLVILKSSGLSNGTLELTPATIGGDEIGTIREAEWRDFDADGDLDLLVSGDEGVYVVVTDGDTFTTHQLTTTLSNASWLSDTSTPPWRIAVATSNPNELVVMTFDATFAIVDQMNFGFHEGAIAWCDVGGSPARDMVTGRNVHLANGTGFAPPTAISATGFFPVCADLDADGNNDLVVGDFGSINFIINQGGLGTPATDFPFQFPAGISIADFDNNGRLDVLVSNGTNERAEIPLVLFDHLEGGFSRQDVLPDWNTSKNDSYGLDIGRPPL
jgi:hypothetical protein